MHRLSDELLIEAYQDVCAAPEGTFDIAFIAAMKDEVSRRKLVLPFAAFQLHLAILRNRAHALKRAQPPLISKTTTVRREFQTTKQSLTSTIAQSQAIQSMSRKVLL